MRKIFCFSRIAFSVAFPLLLAVFGGRAVRADPVQHPLDRLTAKEYATVVEVLKGTNHTDLRSRYSLITLEEPSKDEVSKWKPGEELTRQAFVIIKQGAETLQGVVDIRARKVISWEQIEGVQPGILPTEEWNFPDFIVRRSRQWREAVQKRGIENLGDVLCLPLTAGYYGIAEEEGRRLVKLSCFKYGGATNFWGRPLEGLIVLFDLNSREVVQVIDTGVRPIPKGPVDIDEDSVGELREPTKPITMAQPEGQSFEIDGHTIQWQKWRFHFGIDPRLGPVISTVHYNDDGKWRSILYQGSLSEMFVPYMDPGVGWYFRTFMDAGEYGVGKLAAPLLPGVDCPPNAAFFDAEFADDWGDPQRLERAACIFERYAGDVAWRHYESMKRSNEARRRVELVVRFVATIGNYDYVLDWVFRQNGTIKVALGASGIEQIKAVKSRTIADDKDGRDTAYGRMVAEHTVAVNHDHFFSFRIDLDVDGPENSFLLERLKTKRLPEQSPRKSVWVVDSQVAETERHAKLRISLEEPALWRVINPESKGPLGYPTSYQLKPGTNAISLLTPDDFPQRRAGFTDFHLWVTPYDPSERYAAGTYPNQSKGGDGLPSWTSNNRPIEKTDIVLWYTFGMHHVVRAEDWPVLPTVWTEFELRPFDFFSRNPALDLPK